MPAKKTAAKKAAAPAKKAAAKKATAPAAVKKSAVKEAPAAKKVPAAKKAVSAPAKKAPAAKKVVAQKAVSTPAKKAPAAKKTAAKKAASTPAKKAPAKTAAKKATSKAAAPTKPRTDETLAESIQAAQIAARCAYEMKAENIVILDVATISSVVDAYVICTGTALPHLRAIAREVRDGVLEKTTMQRPRMDGQAESGWLVLDFGVFMVHIFTADNREKFDLEGVWRDGKTVTFSA